MIQLGTSKFDLIFAGHFAMDHKIIHGKETHGLGGTVTFGTLAAAILNPRLRIGIISTVGKDFKSEYRQFIETHGIDTVGIKTIGEMSTHYTLNYFDGGRTLYLSGRAPDLTVDQVPKSYFNTKAVMLGPIAGEVSNDFIFNFLKHAEKSTIVGMDAQGFIRNFAKDGKVLECSMSKKCENIYALIDKLDENLVLKASDTEATAITGKTDPYQATEALCRNKAVIAVTRGAKGSLVKVQGHDIIKIPAFKPREVVDETGAGDAYMAGFLAQYITGGREFANLERCGLVGSATASFLIEEPGPRGFGSQEQIFARIEQKQYLPMN